MPPPGAPAQIFDREPERRSRSPSGRHCVRSEVYLCGCCANGKRHCVWGMSVLESICRTLSVPESMETLHSALEFGCSTKDHCIDEAAQHGDHVRGTLSLIFYAHAAATVRQHGSSSVNNRPHFLSNGFEISNFPVARFKVTPYMRS